MEGFKFYKIAGAMFFLVGIISLESIFFVLGIAFIILSYNAEKKEKGK